MSQGQIAFQDLTDDAVEELMRRAVERMRTEQSKLIDKKFEIRLLNQEKYRGEKVETATLLKIDNGLFLFRFDKEQEEIWIPLPQISSLVEIPPPSPPRNLRASFSE